MLRRAVLSARLATYATCERQAEGRVGIERVPVGLVYVRRPRRRPLLRRGVSRWPWGAVGCCSSCPQSRPGALVEATSVFHSDRARPSPPRLAHRRRLSVRVLAEVGVKRFHSSHTHDTRRAVAPRASSIVSRRGARGGHGGPFVRHHVTVRHARVPSACRDRSSQSVEGVRRRPAARASARGQVMAALSSSPRVPHRAGRQAAVLSRAASTPRGFCEHRRPALVSS